MPQPGATVLEVNGAEYAPDTLRDAIKGEPIELRVRSGKHERRVTIDCSRGNRYPHLEPADGSIRHLDRILEPKREAAS